MMVVVPMPAVPLMFMIVVMVLFIAVPATPTDDAQIGVCYGMLGNNLPSEQEVVNLYKSNGIKLMRIYDPNQMALEALQGSGIQLVLGVPNHQLQLVADEQSEATQWVRTNVVPFSSFIRYIAVGNEVLENDKPFVHSAMENVQHALDEAKLGGQIKVSTAIYSAFIKNSHPPSNAEFSDSPFMEPIVKFLTSNNSPLLVNIYPYFAYIDEKEHIPLDYALFNPGTMVTDDDNNGLRYHNMFDAMVDSMYAALAKAGGPNTTIVVSESGWPSAGDDDCATLSNAETYYRNLINHVKNGTPLKPGQAIETYLFAMFDENEKPGARTEQHFGLFYPDKNPKYDTISVDSKTPLDNFASSLQCKRSSYYHFVYIVLVRMLCYWIL